MTTNALVMIKDVREKLNDLQKDLPPVHTWGDKLRREIRILDGLIAAMEEGTPTPEEFRLAGFSADALNYPRDRLAFEMLCAFNGVKPEQAPKGWGYFPNEGTKAAWHRVANAARAAFGLPEASA